MGEANVLDVLRRELEFVESGGYRGRAWHPPLIFEDSPTCVNFNDPAHPVPCTKCPLIGFVPVKYQEARFPCRKIPLNAQGETLESLYRTSSSREIEAALTDWLRQKIQELETQEKSAVAVACST